MDRDLSHPALSKLKAWYRRVVPEDTRAIAAGAPS
jgi:hypothetical protein